MEEASQKNQGYDAKSILVLKGLSAVRKKYDVIELFKKFKKKGDILIMSKELRIKPRILNSAVDEGRILNILPTIQKGKCSILARLKTNREIKLFIQKYNINNISARQLIRLVKEWNYKIKKTPLTLLTQKEHNLIIGSLLGDASIRQREKNSCFRVSHSIKQKEYLNWKLNILKNFKISEFSEKNKIINRRELNIINLSTNTHPLFNYYRNLFYKNNRKTITKKILKQLNPESLAIWICDDGSYDNTQGYIILCTNAFNLDEHNLMKEFFLKKFNLNPTIGFRDKKYYYLRFKQNDSKKLINIIRPFILKCMKYKIGEKNVC